MPDFYYRATDNAGKIRSGIRFANSIDDLRGQLREIGLYLLDVSGGRGAKLLEAVKSIQLGGFTRDQLIEFSNNFGIMLKAGVPMMSALDELREDAETDYMKKVLTEVLEALNAGETLHGAMKTRPNDFPPMFVRLVQIGEETGNLSQVFFNCGKHYKRIGDLIRNVRKALLYPSFVLVALVLAAFVFLTMVFPPLFSLLKDFKVELPTITRVVMAVSSTLKDQWYLVLGVVLMAVLTFVFMRRYRPTRLFLDWLEVHTPFFRRIFIQIHMTFFLRHLALMLTASIDILQALQLSGSSVTNLIIQNEISNCRLRIIEGSMFSESVRQIPFVSNAVSRMIAVGETSGNLSEQLEYLAEIYNDELERRIALALGLLEPILVFLMAGLALTLVMGVLMPLYDMVSKLSTSVGTGAMPQ
jgi:type II secretory pathway component PulF